MKDRMILITATAVSSSLITTFHAWNGSGFIIIRSFGVNENDELSDREPVSGYGGSQPLHER